MLTTANNETSVTIDGPAGKLEMTLGEPISADRGAWGIVCHPHPLHGGSMQNKVVSTLAKTFQYLGLRTIRFNFRGVGKSEGYYADGEGELKDLLAVINWIREEKGEQEIWLAGFSFGAYIAIKATLQYPIDTLVTVAPPVNNFSLANLPPITCPWVLVQGDRDDVVPAADVYAWAEKLDPTPHILRFPEAGHFFHGILGELRARLEEVLKN